MSDAPRPGAPAKFTPEVICQIIALACADPEALDVHFTLKHASWINQIEIWFSILVRKLLPRGSFTSKEHLQQRIESFIAHFNATMAKPFRWTMKGRPLAA